MKFIHFVIILICMAMQPGRLISQKFHGENKYELLVEESMGYIDSSIRSRLLLGHENGGEFVKMYAEGGPVHGVLQITGVDQDTVSGSLRTIFPTSCQCLKYRDTIEISSAFGLYPSGIAFNFRVYTGEEHYKVVFSSGDDSDNNLLFKKHPNDEEFLSRIEDEFQKTSFKLHLAKEVTDQVVYGEFIGETRPYYERLRDGQLERHHYRLTSLFRCTVLDLEKLLDKK